MGILTEEMKRMVREQRATTGGADGRPNVSRKATTTVWDDDSYDTLNRPRVSQS